jgi:hypothetical protein
MKIIYNEALKLHFKVYIYWLVIIAQFCRGLIAIEFVSQEEEEE